MIPPTPTFLPPAAPGSVVAQARQVSLNNVSLWEMAPDAVGLWGSFRDFTPVLQWVFVAVLVVILVWSAVTLIKSLSEEEA
jgi:hypothetical protein